MLNIKKSNQCEVYQAYWSGINYQTELECINKIQYNV